MSGVMDEQCRWPCPWGQSFSDHEKRRFKGPLRMVVFDMDGVLSDGVGSWRAVHEFFSTSNDDSVVDFLKGKIDNEQFIASDIDGWRERDGRLTTISVLEEIYKNTPLMPGAHEVIDFLKKHDVRPVIVSAGVHVLAELVAQKLGIDDVFANVICSDESGRLTGRGKVCVPLLSKDFQQRRLAEELGIGLGEIVAVGNSCFDVPMFQAAGLGVAFCPEDECVRRMADVVIEKKDLCALIEIVAPFIE